MSLVFILLGLVSGIFAGLLGIGGGIITVPALYYLLTLKGFPPGQVMHVAVATSLAVIFVTTLLSTWIHYRRGCQFDLPILGFLVPGLIIGCISGAELAHLLPSDILRRVFGIVAVLIGGYFSFPSLPIPEISKTPNMMLSFFGLIIGHLSSLLGIGGGIFTVPVLLSYRIPTLQVVGTSSLATATTSLIGTLTYLMMAPEVHPTRTSFGFIDPAVFIFIAIGSICSTPIGVKLAQVLPAPRIKQVFGIIMVLTGITLVIS